MPLSLQHCLICPFQQWIWWSGRGLFYQVFTLISSRLIVLPMMFLKKAPYDHWFTLSPEYPPRIGAWRHLWHLPGLCCPILSSLSLSSPVTVHFSLISLSLSLAQLWVSSVFVVSSSGDVIYFRQMTHKHSLKLWPGILSYNFNGLIKCILGCLVVTSHSALWIWSCLLKNCTHLHYFYTVTFVFPDSQVCCLWFSSSLRPHG